MLQYCLYHLPTLIKKNSADFRQRLQGSPQTTIQLVRACAISQTLNMYCFALNFPRW